MTPVEYSVDLPASVSTVVNVAHHTLGVGSNGCGPRPLDPYRVWSTPDSFSYVLRLLPARAKHFPEHARVAAPDNRLKPAIPETDQAATIHGKVIEASSFEDGEGNPEHATDGDDLQISALPYTDEIMTPIEYSVDLPASVSTVVNVAHHTLGVGSNGCGPRPLEPYRVWSTPDSFSYVLRLLPARAKHLSEHARVAAPDNRLKPAMPEPDQAATIHGKVIEASSFEEGEGNPEHATDGDPETFWHSRWSHDEAQPPHFLVLDFGKPLDISALIYTARTDSENGHVKDYELYASNDAQSWSDPVARGRFPSRASEQRIGLAHPVTARYLKFVILSEQRDRPFVSVAELEVEKPGDSLK
jgi:hypothetical protein